MAALIANQKPCGGRPMLVEMTMALIATKISDQVISEPTRRASVQPTYLRALGHSNSKYLFCYQRIG